MRFDAFAGEFQRSSPDRFRPAPQFSLVSIANGDPAHDPGVVTLTSTELAILRQAPLLHLLTALVTTRDGLTRLPVGSLELVILSKLNHCSFLSEPWLNQVHKLSIFLEIVPSV